MIYIEANERISIDKGLKINILSRLGTGCVIYSFVREGPGQIRLSISYVQDRSSHIYQPILGTIAVEAKVSRCYNQRDNVADWRSERRGQGCVNWL